MYSVFLKLLNEKGVRASDVGKATGINSTFFSEWKKGKNNPKIDKLEKIANYFGVSVDYLRTGKEPEKKPFQLFELEDEHLELIENYRKLSDENKKFFLELVKKLGENP